VGNVIAGALPVPRGRRPLHAGEIANLRTEILKPGRPGKDGPPGKANGSKPVMPCNAKYAPVSGQPGAALNFLIRIGRARTPTKSALTQAEQFHQISHAGQHGGDPAMRA
jgi:hypothetical protein